MISEVNRSVNPIGLFAGGTSISGGSTAPIITSNFDASESSSVANYPKGLPSSFSTSYSHGITDATIDKATFKSRVNYSSTINSGRYVFRSYENSGTKWAMTSHPQSYTPTGTDLNNIDIADYGITLTGTVAVGEGLEIEYYQGETSSDYSVSVITIIRTNYGSKFLVGDMNLIGYLGTLERYRRQFGGIRTYDVDFASAIGGYPKGSQLEYLQTITESGSTRYILRKVLSLIDDNTYNFVETPSYIDNIHWMYCDVLDENTPTLPSTKMTPKIICWVNNISLNGGFNASYSATLAEDSYVTATVSPIYIVSGSGGIGGGQRQVDINVTATLNGNTKTILENYQYYNPNHYHYDYGSGELMRKGTTINVSINAIKHHVLGVCVIAVPALTNTIERL